MVRRWQRRRERQRERPMRRVRAQSEAGAAEDAPRRVWSRVPALGPYEFRYDVSDGYQDDRVVDVR